ncbi:FeoA family protein [Roseofilum sp. BLCC_M154]|uniref:FeoA family protein n=1 Tax=Roseofilum acuticapitatum BLCC-M154 TaxID=3022444 RepID=A0ABT7ATW9_9CYAN|nr:FeoA family protein [Roseofilum acuticapitatum]MDJ1170334.1 FeoA family protein [Roseofilum acuticapitatum BLCC-M154]
MMNHSQVLGWIKGWGGKKRPDRPPGRGQHHHGHYDSLGVNASPEAPAELEISENSGFLLSEGRPGQQVWVRGFREKGGISRLLAMGITPGSQLQILSRQGSGSVVVAIADNRLGLGAGLASRVIVTETNLSLHPNLDMENPTSTLHLGDLSVGEKGRIIGYENTHRAYKSKLLSMGLTPGTEFTITRVAPLGDPVAILVRGFHLSVRKQEAEALKVESL